MHSIVTGIFVICFTTSLVISVPITADEQEIKREKVIVTANQLLKELANENLVQENSSQQKIFDNNRAEDYTDSLPVITYTNPDYQNSNDYEIDDWIDMDDLIALYERQRLRDLFNGSEDDESHVPMENMPIIDDRMLKIEYL